MITQRSDRSPRIGLIALVTIGATVGVAVPAVASGVPGGGDPVIAAQCTPDSGEDAVTLLERPSYVEPLASADRAERIIARELERRRLVALTIQGPAAERLAREAAGTGD